MSKTFTSVFAYSLFLLLFGYQSNLLSQGGNALDFDGVDDLITVATINETFHTIEFYLNYNSTLDGSGAQSLPFGFNGASSWIGLNQVSGALLNETITIANGGLTTSTDTDISAGWHHIAIVSNGTNYDQIYIDGIAANMIASSAPVLSNTNIDIGRMAGATTFVFGGKLEEIRIWNVSRVLLEIQSTLHQELTGGETGLVTYFNFNQGVAGGANGGIISLPDESGAGNTGTLSGFTLNGIVSNWILSDAPLPVEFLSFKAVNTLDGISLNWLTTQEINNSGFEVQFSRDITQWENLGFVDAKGSFEGTNSYQFLHTKPLKGINYYRLKQIDINGAVDYSDVVSLYTSGLGTFNVYPNPSSDIITIEGIDLEYSRYRIMDNAGRIVQKADLSSKQIDISFLAKGLYLISIQTTDKNIVERIIKN